MGIQEPQAPALLNAPEVFPESQIDIQIKLLKRLSEKVSSLPSVKCFKEDYFKARKGGKKNDPIIGVFAFRASLKRKEPYIEVTMQPFDQGVDLLVDALVVRFKDIESFSMADVNSYQKKNGIYNKVSRKKNLRPIFFFVTFFFRPNLFHLFFF